MSEIFVSNINPFAPKHEAILAIASHLHKPGSPYSINGLPLNFNFRPFHKDKPPGACNSGVGILTFPTHSMGALFLSQYGQEYRTRKIITLHGQALKFRHSVSPQKSISEPDLQIVKHILATKYRDPEPMEEMPVPCSSIQFGWECRDNVLSIEWEYHCPSTLSFHPDQRRITISLATSTLFTYQIVMSYSQIQDMFLITHTSPPALFLRLDRPPIFHEYVPSLKQCKRLSSLPLQSGGRKHSDVAPFLSLAILLVFTSEQALQILPLIQTTFEINEAHVQIERRALFSSQALETFFSWASELTSFPVAYRMQSLVFDQSVDPTEILEMQDVIRSFFRKDNVVSEINYIVHVLEQFGARARSKSLCSEGRKNPSLRSCFADAIRDTEELTPLFPRKDPSIFMCFHVYVTPTGLILDGPNPEVSNSVVRRLPFEDHSRLIRVSFVDEGKHKLQHSHKYSITSLLEDRTNPILKNGLHILGRQYNFLSYSMSALKEHTAWFFSNYIGIFNERSRKTVTRDVIITSLGTFDTSTRDRELMHCTARYAARISQNFTTTVPTFTDFKKLKVLPDIESEDNEGVTRVHTDGIGTLSPKLAMKFHLEQLSPRQQTTKEAQNYPRAFLIRYAGCKGMLSVDVTLSGLTVCLRKSMNKFQGRKSYFLNIAKAFYKPGRVFLNRPLIMILEGLGVQYEVFKKYQDEAIRVAEESSRSISDAAFFLESNDLGRSFRLPYIFRNLSKIKTLHHDHPFYLKIVEFALHHFLRGLKHKSRIPIPDAWNLPGICDIHEVLGENEIFVCIDYFDGRKPFFVQGEVLIWRSPVIHPGDVQVVNAIGPPPADSPYAKDPLANTLIFNVKDKRPISTTLGGGDVDGDEYQIIPLERHPKFQIAPREAATYPSAARHQQPSPSNIDDIAMFFQNFITSDTLGLISIRWLEIADRSDKSIFDERCLKLSELHSQAVDYPKSGSCVPMEHIPKFPFQILPDWKASETTQDFDHHRYYASERAIGRLFRDVKLRLDVNDFDASGARYQQFADISLRHIQQLAVNVAEAFTHGPAEYYMQPEDNDCLVLVRQQVMISLAPYGIMDDETITKFLMQTSSFFLIYRTRLYNICATDSLHSHCRVPLTEEEAVVGTIISNTSQPRHRKDQIAKFREHTLALVKRVQNYILGEGTVSPQESLCRAFLTWELGLCIQHSGRNDPLFGVSSFNLIALGTIFDGIQSVDGIVDT